MRSDSEAEEEPSGSDGEKENEINETQASSKISGNFQENLMGYVAQMFNNPTYSDIKVTIQGEVLHAHRFVICQCDYFKKAFQNDGTKIFAEGQTNSIEFNYGSAAAYWRVFEYLYKGKYSQTLDNINIKDDPYLLKDIRVFVLADMFILSNLKNIARSALLVKLYNSKIDEDYVECVREIFATTSDTAAREYVISTTHDKVNSATIVYNNAGKEQSSLLLDDHLLDLIREGGDFAVDYFLAADAYRISLMED